MNIQKLVTESLNLNALQLEKNYLSKATKKLKKKVGNLLNKIGSFFSGIIPKSKPVLSLNGAVEIAKSNGINLSKEVCIIGLRGFFSPGKNKRAVYDDAIFVLADNCFVAFNANCDPGAFRTRIANLKEGSWLYKIGIHGLSKPKALQYKALVQANEVTVVRDNVGLDTGWFGINIHRGQKSSVSSLGCQTIPPDQWQSFISLVESQMKMRKQKTIRYVLQKV